MIEWIIAGVVILVLLIIMYRVVPPSEAHLVNGPTGKMVCSSDKQIASKAGRWHGIYFNIPLIRKIRILDLTTKEIIVDQETYESKQARYLVSSSTKYRILDVQKAAERYINNADLQNQLKEIVKSSVRAVTVKYDVLKARAEKQTMEDAIRTEMGDDFGAWGLELINFQLIDFQDTTDSKIISNISERREAEISAQTRMEVAEKKKEAAIKEAEADQLSKEKEIERDKQVGIFKQEQVMEIAKREQDAKTEEYMVKQIETVRQAEIDKQQAEIKAEQEKEVAIIDANKLKEAETINKEQKRLDGEGDKLKAEEIAKGEAAPIREKGNAEAEIIKAKGLAEAEAKEKLQLALNKFEDKAIRALVAEKIVAKDEAIGVATAAALKEADVKVFAGGTESDKNGFDMAKWISSMSTGNGTTADAILNKVARGNDLGMVALGLKSLADDNKSSTNGKPKKAKV